MYVDIASISSTDNINEMRGKNIVKMSVELFLSLDASDFYDTMKQTFVGDLSWKDLEHLNCKKSAK
jgi:hypothetical protein